MILDNVMSIQHLVALYLIVYPNNGVIVVVWCVHVARTPEILWEGSKIGLVSIYVDFGLHLAG